ncbi:MAG TPA: hypothetical protein VIT23_06635, partial [Terrimicrobiaceae bacterium]
MDLLKKLILRNKVVSAGIAGSVLVIVSGALISIYFLNAKLRSANNQYVLAERRLLLANQKEQEAKLAADAARSEQARAESALAEMQRAEDAAKQAQELARQSSAQTKVEPERREELEQVSTHSEGKLHEEITTTEKVVPTEPAVEVQSKKVDVSPAIADEAQQLVVHASEVFDKLSRDGLRILAKSPEEVVRRLSGAMESVSRALIIQPNFGAAWMLKGRLHWSLMEFEPAIESFRQAANLASAEQSPSGPDSPREVLALAESLPKAGVDRYLKAADILEASSLPQNATAGNILKLLSRKPTLRKSAGGGPGPLRRNFTANEIAVELIRRNGMKTRVFFKGTDSDQIDVIIWGSPELRDLSPLREIDVSGLALVGARTLDWQTIYSLPMERLDFSKCSIESFPQGP